MKLFKNKVGRPSNADIRKRKIFYAGIVFLAVLLVGVGFLLTNKYINRTLGAVSKKECLMPYTRKNCYNKKNNTVKKVQQMLKILKYYKGRVNGKFNLRTYNAVRKFQRDQKIERDGNIGPDTLKRIAKKANVKYFVIKFNKNGGSGELNSSYNNELVVINGIATKLPSVKLSKSKREHVGYFAVAKAKDGRKYKYGGFLPENGGKSTGAHSVSEIGNRKFYNYLYKLGSKISETGWEDGQVVTFKAVYCKAGAYYDTNKSKCIAKSTGVDKSSPYYLTPQQELILKASVCQENSGSYESAKAVIDTMMNRVDNKCFSNTLWGVLTASNQFEAYGAGHYTRRISNNKLKPECKNAEKAVNEALRNPSNRSHKYLCFSFGASGDYKIVDGIYYSNACVHYTCVN